MVSDEFEEENTIEDAKTQMTRRGGVKLDSSKSKFSKKNSSEEEFTAKVNLHHTKTIDTNNRAMELAKQFWDMIRNKELIVNKGPTTKSIEKETFNNLIAYARELNNDPEQLEDSMGSVALITLLMKTVIYQRDLCNEFEFRLVETEKQLKKLSSVGKTNGT